MRRSPLADSLVASLQARDVAEDDGGLVRYAERIAQRTESRPCPMAHLAPAARLFERAMAGEQVRAVIAGPVRHGKTTLDKAVVLRSLRLDPKIRINYASYASDLAEAKMYEVRQLAPSQGIRLDPSFATDAEWRTIEGGAVKSGGLIGGPWNGQGANLGIVDDPYKNSEQADSAAFRARTSHAFWSAFMTRLEPGASCFVIAARWGDHDLSAELIKKGWEYVNMPAINDSGEPLWPERWPLKDLLAIKASTPARLWAALYQGKPRPEENGKVFDLARLATYDRLPDGAYTEALGLDLAYGLEQRNDRSAYTVFRRYAADPRRLYRVECDSRRAPIELYSARVAEAQIRRGSGRLDLRALMPTRVEDVQAWQRLFLDAQYAHARRIEARWYTSTTEAGTGALMAGYGARVEAVGVGRRSKLVRVTSGGYGSAWAEGRIVVPAVEDAHGERWRIAHDDFTGEDGCEDDEVDGACAAHDLLALPVPQLGDDRHVVGAGDDERLGGMFSGEWGAEG